MRETAVKFTTEDTEAHRVFVSIHACSIRIQSGTSDWASLLLYHLCHSSQSVVSTRQTTLAKSSSAYNKKMINLWKNFLFHCKKIIFALEMYISRLEIYISKLKICISRLKMNFSAYSEHSYP